MIYDKFNPKALSLWSDFSPKKGICPGQLFIQSDVVLDGFLLTLNFRN